MSQTIAAAFTPEGRRARPEIAVRSGELTGLVFPIDKARILLGRSEECDVRFSNLAISRKHAEILRIGDECVVVDLESRLGTYVNGRRVRRAELSMGDQVLLSGVLIEFRVRYEAQSTDADIEEDLEDAPGLVGAGPALHAIRLHGEPVERIPLTGDGLSVGRHSNRDVVIEHPLISRRHAALVREEDGWYVIDTKSRFGTFVNGRAVIRTRIERGDRVQFGPVRFLFDEMALVHLRAYSQVTLEARNLSVRVQTGERILEDVSVRVEPSEIVGIIGPSGSGKTTLLNALSGFRRATGGLVTLNDRDLYAEYTSFSASMGYVPQDDIIHTELTPEQALRYAALLRLPRDTSGEEIDRIVDETLDILGLDERRDLRVGKLSGGQRKRVSLGVELLTRASLLFLDEPTSGLDPGTEARMMRLFRKLADQGRTLVLTTHVMENVDLLDKVAVLYEGRLVYFGPPKEMMRYFGITKATHLYDVLEEKTVGEWWERFAEQAQPQDADETTHVEHRAEESSSPRAQSVTTLRQLRVLTRRYARILVSEPRNVALMVIQPVIIFPTICAVFQHAGTILFMSALAMFWLGCTNAAREIVKERSVYLRERMVGIGVVPYISSKVAVLAVVSLLQTLFAVAVVCYAEGVPGSPILYSAALGSATLCGLATGLLISAMASNSEQATAVMPMILIPQIVFAGFVLDVERMNVGSRLVSHLVSTRWTYDALKYTFQERNYDIIRQNTLLVMGFAGLLTLASMAYLWWRDRSPSSNGKRRPKRA